MFLCIRCAGIHRNLGVHISRVKSVNLDSWTPEQVVSLQNMGNSRARAVYEAQLPDGFRRPQTDSALESFIRAKYEHKKYMAREWVPTAPVKANWDKEVDEEMERQKRKKKTSSSSSSSLSLNSSVLSMEKKTTTVSAKSPIPAPLPKPQGNSSSPKSARTVTSAAPAATIDNKFDSSDLLGLGSPTTSNGHNQNTIIADLTGSTDVFSNFLSGPPATSNVEELANSTMPTTTVVQNNTTSLAKQEQDFFNQVPSENGKSKMTKDSILALYGTAPSTTPSLAQFSGGGAAVFNQFGATQTGFAVPPHMGVFATSQQSLGQFGGVGQVPNQNFIPSQQQQHFGGFNATAGGGGFPQMQPQQQTHQLQSFAQFPPNQNSAIAANFPTSFGSVAPPATTANNTNINQQFGNLNLGNVWQ